MKMKLSCNPSVAFLKPVGISINIGYYEPDPHLYMGVEKNHRFFFIEIIIINFVLQYFRGVAKYQSLERNINGAVPVSFGYLKSDT